LTRFSATRFSERIFRNARFTAADVGNDFATRSTVGTAEILLNHRRTTGLLGSMKQKAVVVLLIVAAAHPERKLSVLDRHAPAPIFWARFVGLESGTGQSVEYEFRQSLAVQVRIDLLLLPWVWRKCCRPEFNVRPHADTWRITVCA
jgi:hypothetical protein